MILLIFNLFCFSCTTEQTNELSVESEKPVVPLLSFAVAGHAYGNPDTYTHSLHPPFWEKLKSDHRKNNFDYLFLTGDLIYDSSETTASYIRSQLDSFSFWWYVAPGNHDLPSLRRKDTVSDSDVDMVYISHGRNEFFVFNTSNPGWTLGGKEAFMVSRIVENMNPDSVDNIFVFTHQLWWERNSKKEFDLDSLRPNSFAFYEGASDFWKDVFTSFEKTGIETWFFAGDMGAFHQFPAYYEDHYENFHFYGSGMGGRKDDNYLDVKVYENGDVDIVKVNF